MSEPWPATSLESARNAQRRRGWSDRTLLAQMLVLVRTHGAGQATPPEDDALAALDAAADGSDAERVVALARVLPGCWGYFGTSLLEEPLERQPALDDDQVEAILTTPGFLPDDVRHHVASRPSPPIPPARPRRARRRTRAERLRPLVLLLTTWTTMVVLAVAWLLLAG